MSEIRARARRLAAVASRRHFPEVVTALLGVFSVVYALYLITQPEKLSTANFTVVREWAPIRTWGVVLLVPAVASLAALAARRRDLFWPLCAITAWYTLWGYGFGLALHLPGSVGTGTIVYLFVASVSAACALVYSPIGRREGP